MAGLYFHIPFCRQACHYCDFHFSTNLKLREGMITAMANELALRKNEILEEVSTCYFGGGTPSILSPQELERIFTAFYDNFHVSQEAEITLEANPDDITKERLKSWKALGINRLSIGIQTFNDQLLKYLNRIHTGTEAIKSIELARNSGFDNLNCDLIYALPAEGHSIFKQDVEKMISFLPQHISAYNLTIEPKTVFGKWLKTGKITEMNEDFATEQYLNLCSSLANAGYQHYEVSNFALPGLQSKHNTSYWEGVPYIGIGPGAHSFIGHSRKWNISNNAHYIKSLANDQPASQQEVLGTQEKVNEYLLTGLRTARGVNLDYLKEEHQYELSAQQHYIIEQVIKKGLGMLNNGHLALNEKGFLLADQVALELSM